MAKRGTSVYYPAAGLDLDSFVHTGIRRGVFLDPGYFRQRRQPRMTVRDIARKVQRLDAHARFIRPGRRALIAIFIAAGRRRRLTFIRGRTWNDEHLARRHLGSRCVVLLKGCLLPEVLLPPPGITDMKAVAFALDLLHMPPYTTTIRRAYSGCLLELPAQEKETHLWSLYVHACSDRAGASGVFGRSRYSDLSVPEIRAMKDHSLSFSRSMHS